MIFPVKLEISRRQDEVLVNGEAPSYRVVALAVDTEDQSLTRYEFFSLTEADPEAWEAGVGMVRYCPLSQAKSYLTQLRDEIDRTLEAL